MPLRPPWWPPRGALRSPWPGAEGWGYEAGPLGWADVRPSGRWLWALPVLFVVGIVLIADSLWFADPADEARSAPTGAPSPTPVDPSPTASPTADAAAAPSITSPSPTVAPTTSPTVSPAPERWSFCTNVSVVEDLRGAVLRGTKRARALVRQAEELEAHLVDPRLDDLKDLVGRLRRAIEDADEGYASDFEVQGWAEALELVSTTAQVQLGCKGVG